MSPPIGPKKFRVRKKKIIDSLESLSFWGGSSPRRPCSANIQLASNLHFLAQFAEILPPQSFSQRYLQKHLAYFKIKKIFTSLAWGGVEMGVPTTPSGWFKYHKTTARTLLRTRALFWGTPTVTGNGIRTGHFERALLSYFFSGDRVNRHGSIVKL